MPIYFRNTPVIDPFTFDSIGNHWNQERVSRPKGYPLYHYLQTEQGQGNVEILGKNYTLNEKEGLLIAPFIPHSYSNTSKEWITSFATFTGVIENSIAKILGNRQFIFVSKEHGEQIENLISDIVMKYENPPVDTKSLSIDCYCLLMDFVDGGYTHSIMNQPLYKRYVDPIVKEIETHFNQALTVQKLSGQVYITPQYLSRLFGRFLGCSVYEYLTNYRINKAKEFLLADTQLEIQEIAQRVGFLDTSHFIAIFKKITGFTPLEFRRLN